MSRAGVENVLYTFDYSHGGFPQTALIEANGTMYGTTAAGGESGNGTIYSISTGGVESVIYSFATAPDGAGPQASLISRKGTFYDTTAWSGVGCGAGQGCGTAFALSR
jgi:uncharacterized repeat protein (TIGR03803 family)